MVPVRVDGPILVPTDGSLTAQRAMEHAVHLAEGFDVNLEALYVVDTSTPFPGSKRWTKRKEAFRQDLVQEGRERLKEAKDSLRERGVKVTSTVIEHDGIAEGIAGHASSLGAGVIVMGTHGRSGVGRFLLGSVAERLLRLSKVPVLLVPPSPTSEP